MTGGSRWRAALAASLLAVALAACGSPGGGGRLADTHVEAAAWGATLRPGGVPKRGGTLVVDQNIAPLTISAYRMMEATGTPDRQIVAQMFDQLAEYAPGQLEPRPALATSWEVSPDGLSYTFHLRPGVTFSNGMPFTSADVRFTLDHARGPDSFFKDTLFATVASIETPDPLTAVVRLSRPTPSFLYSVAMVAASIVPKALVESEGAAAFNEHPVGTGPFMLQHWIKDQEAVLVRNPTHWRTGRPYLDELKIRVTPNDNTRILNVLSGTSDAADSIPFPQIRTIDESGRATVLVGAGGDMYVIWSNNATPPFTERAVRQALAYATPVDDINTIAFGGVAPIMNTVYPKAKYWNEAAPGYPYDPGKAKALLATTSVPHGFATTINIVGTDQPSNQVAQIVQQAWATIGVTVTIQRLDHATLGARFLAGDAELSIFPPGEWANDVVVDDEFASLLFDSPATHNLYTYLANPEAAALTRRATTTLDEAERKRLFDRLQLVTIDNPPVIPLVYTPNRIAVGNTVHGFNDLMAGSFWRLDEVWKD
ncbi:ABC transporter substrate-binding protein [Pseudonocardia acaciae]|uniref:ABC transporter substrate-binding protein n=1 Tax=Pseudonocardia acaciae TaxID=551276 RepID=UPI00048D7DA6|nr:ABC transporter substrate-binding protein [Pseudonocardia acaciae]